MSFIMCMYNKFPVLYILESLSFGGRKMFATLYVNFQLRALDFFIEFNNY